MAVSKQIRADEILADIQAGLRTKDFLAKYQLSMQEFEEVLRSLIRKGLLSREEFRDWKARRPVADAGAASGDHDEETAKAPLSSGRTVSTLVIDDPERNNSWALQLFSTSRDRLPGARFKVMMHGKRYSFVVERILFRGPVQMLESAAPRPASKEKRDQALEFISRHGWAAYLENRAYAANFDLDGMREAGKARLVLLHCRNQTFVAALHTPMPAINLYVAGSLQALLKRLAKTIDTRSVDILAAGKRQE